MVVSILTAASPVMLAQEVIKIAASQRSQMGLPASANPTVGNGNRATEWRSPACHPTPAMAAPAPETYEACLVVRCSQLVSLARSCALRLQMDDACIVGFARICPFLLRGLNACHIVACRERLSGAITF